MQVIDVNEPTLSSFIIRVGGVLAIFVIAILITTEFFPGYEGYVVLVISGLGIFFLSAKEIMERSNRTKKRKK